ncbi:restriction endonuclease [Lacrimispora sp. AGF001]|uniref:restriction endonuclease n=1 Tax=Lacrimispora sp. AGF001 TaxID=3401631 RepID=UPI003B428E74
MKFEELANKIKEIYCEYEIESEDTIRIFKSYDEGMDIVIEYDHGKFNIYADLLIEVYHPTAEYGVGFIKMAYIDSVLKRADIDIAPSCKDDYSTIKFGYFGIDSSEELVFRAINILDIDGDMDFNNINNSLIREKYPEIYSTFEFYKNLFIENFTDNLDESWVDAKKVTKVSQNLILEADDNIYVKTDLSIICGIGEKALKKLGDLIDLSLQDLHGVYTGMLYSVGRNHDKVYLCDKLLLNEFLSLINETDAESYYGIDYYVNESGNWIVQCGDIWGVVLNSIENVDVKLLKERDALIYCLDKLKDIMPEDNKTDIFDLTKITYSQFEQMCCDILVCIGFKNVKLRGNTNAPDGGVDIEALEEFETIFRREERRWLFQCKHTKSQINRKDISEIDDLLKEFEADMFGIFYTGLFSPDTLDRIYRKSKKVETWDKNQIKALLNKHPQISKKYFGI